MIETATTHHGRKRTRRVRLNKTDTAAQAIGPLTESMEVYCLTFGQFSLIDAIEHLVRQAGPCEVAVSTWTAATADAERAHTLLAEGNIRRFRLLVDRSFISRQAAYCAEVTRLFGADAIRTTKTHAKFAAITNDDWSIVVRTSMNLNHNPRLESIEISDDPDLAGFMAGIIDQVWAETPGGATRCEDLPILAGMRTDDTPSPVTMGATVEVGKVAS